MGWDGVEALATAAAVVVAVVAFFQARSAKKAADAAETVAAEARRRATEAQEGMAAALSGVRDELAKQQEPGARWDITYRGANRFSLTNVGNEDAHDVDVDCGPEELKTFSGLAIGDTQSLPVPAAEETVTITWTDPRGRPHWETRRLPRR